VAGLLWPFPGACLENMPTEADPARPVVRKKPAGQLARCIRSSLEVSCC
jgi:hypothetical protein